MSDDERRILVAMGVGHNPGDVSTIILGVSETSFAEMQQGIAKDINLVPLGIAAQILVMGGKDHDDIKRRLSEAAAKLEVPIGGLADLSVPKPRSN